MEKTWHPTNPKPRYIPPIVSFVFAIILMFAVSVSEGLSNTDILGIISATILLIYGAGKLYAELTLKNNYIKITETGIQFRESPALGIGWIPVTKTIPFDQIDHVDLVEIKSPIMPEANQPFLMITTKANKSYVIGRDYSVDQLQKIAIALSGVSTLTNKLLRFINKATGKDMSLQDLINTGKRFIKSFTEPTQQKQMNNDTDDDDEGEYIIIDD